MIVITITTKIIVLLCLKVLFGKLKLYLVLVKIFIKYASNYNIFRYGACHSLNPFGPYDKSGASGISYKGADKSGELDNNSFDNLTYFAFLIRNYN